jgi:hypothetical protein
LMETTLLIAEDICSFFRLGAGTGILVVTWQKNTSAWIHKSNMLNRRPFL